MPEAAAPNSTLLNKVLWVLLIASVIGLGIWQYVIVSGKGGSVQRNSSVEGLAFKLVDGTTVTLPDQESDKYTVLIFWDSRSERSLAELAEATKLARSAEIDTVLQFYFINLDEDLAAVEQAVNTDELADLVGYDPSGAFLDQYQIRALPLTVLLAANGKSLDLFEGYEEGELESRSQRWIRSYEATGPSGDFKFNF